MAGFNQFLLGANGDEAEVYGAGIDVTTSFVEGEHEWGLWDGEIQRVLAWLPIRQRALDPS